jgi:hypothetical protein
MRNFVTLTAHNVVLIKLWKRLWEYQEAYMEQSRNVDKIIIGKPENKRPIEIRRR